MLEHSIDHSSSNLAKIKLFRSLFVGREDVFARRYENEKKGTTRREDIMLQKNGYRVLRFLVEDVCEHLDDIMDTILASV